MSQCKDCVNSRIKSNYDKDPGKKIAKTREYHLANPEWSKEKLSAWHKENRESRRIRVKGRLATDPEFLLYRRKIQANSERKRRAIKAATEVEHITVGQYEEVLARYNGTCWICGQVPMVISWDHVHPLAKGGAHVIENLRPACTPCNSRKNDTWPFTEDMRASIAFEVLHLPDLEEVMP